MKKVQARTTRIDCKVVNGQRLCKLTDVARAARVHRNALYQSKRIKVIDLFGVALVSAGDAKRYLSERRKK